MWVARIMDHSSIHVHIAIATVVIQLPRSGQQACFHYTGLVGDIDR